MGKSRLLHEFLGNLAHGAWHVMRVETTAQSTAIPYFLIAALLREFVGCSQEDTTAEVAARLPSVIASLGLDPRIRYDASSRPFGQGSGRGRLRQDRPPSAQSPAGAVAAPDPAALCRSASPHSGGGGLSLARRVERGGAGRAVRRNGRGPPCPAGDDASGAPSRLAPPDPAGRRRQSGPKMEIELKHLTAGQADHLLQELIGGSDELAPLRAHIIARADGTPFFLEEFARSLHELGAIAGGAPRLTNIVIPASVQSILAARIDRLLPLHRRILQIAAVIGRDVPLPLLAALADMHEFDPGTGDRGLACRRIPGRGQPANRHRPQFLACADAGRRL